MKKTTIQITGMHCSSCEMLIKETLGDIKGIHSVDVSAKNGIAHITHDDAVSKAELCKAIESEGYKTS